MLVHRPVAQPVDAGGAEDLDRSVGEGIATPQVPRRGHNGTHNTTIKIVVSSS
jgi:hypothetical protein